jgi:ankyrin repeat protein
MKIVIFQEQLVASKGPAEDTALHLAARKGDNDLVKFFIEAGAKVDAQNVSILSRKLKSRYGARNQFQESSLELNSQAT